MDLVGGRFVIEREAGAGAMARVYRARDVTTDAIVALKILNGAGEQTLRRFEREAGALAELVHPGIVGYVAHGATATGQPFLAMEWLAGESLDARLERGAPTIEEVLTLGRTVATALGAAHARGLVHRDVKPANIFLVDGDVARAKLVDFGLTRDTLATYALTNTGDLLGTPLYMAPEQASCEVDLDARCDVYALGAVLYTCLAGRAPLLAPNLVGLLAKIVLEDPPPLTGVPSAVASLVARMLAKKREDRPASGADAARAIEDAAAQLSSGPRRPSEPVVPSREQRVISLLLASHAKAEAAQLDATLGSHGGVLGLADGSAMIVFSGPETPGDLAARAARAALGMRTPQGVVSLATGRAVLSGPTPVGEVIDRAAAALAAPDGSIRVDVDTAALLEGRFELASDERGAALVGERAGALDSVRTLLGKPTRCIGRDRELAAIEGHFAESATDGVARAVIVIADAGVGKSRLAREVVHRLASHADAPAVFVARCESITASSPFAAAAAALRGAAGIAEDMPATVRADRLAALLARDGADDADTREFLGELLAIRSAEPSERMRAARENPSLMFDHIRAAWIHWLRRVSAGRPVLLVIEDLHWADESSVLLVDAALGALAEERFMVLALARPEVRTRRPWATRRPHELRLDPLGKRASEKLVRDALGELATDEVVASIVGRAEGHALFLEELVRAAASTTITALPVGVIGTLQLRFDSLGPESRAVLRVASVYGERFSRAGVAALVSNAVDVDTALAELVAAELVGKASDGFAFRHALVREAAYALLPDDDRSLAHALAAQHLEREGSHEPAVIARHYELGARLADAGRWYVRAAEQALARNDLAGALAHARLAQSWLEGTSAGELDLLIAEAEMWRGNLPDARSAGERAVARLPTGGQAWFSAVGLVATSAGQLGDNNAVVDWIERIIDLPPDDDAVEPKVLALCRASSQLAWADQTDLARRAFAEASALAAGLELGPLARARLEFTRGYDALIEGLIDECSRTFELVASLYERVGAMRDAVQVRMIGVTMAMFAGAAAEALEPLLECMAAGKRIDAQYLVDWARFEYALGLLVDGHREAGERELAQVPPSLTATPLFRGGLTMVTCWSRFADGDVDGVERALAAVGSTVLATRHRAGCAAYAAFVQYRRGDVAAGTASARAAFEDLVRAPGMIADVHLAGFAAALTTLALAGERDVRGLVDGQIGRLEAIAARMTDPVIADAFLHRLPWNVELYRLRERLA